MAGLKVAIAMPDGVQALDVAGPVDVFAEANNYLPFEDQYETVLVAAERNPLRASNGMQILADTTFEEATGGFGIILVAGAPTLPDVAPASPLIEWIKGAPRMAGTYGSICTGAFVLGHAGLLDHRRATTHWLNAPTLAAKFPAATIEPDAIFVRDGRLITSAGVTAGIDLALALVRQHHGSEVMTRVAKWLVVVAQRQGGQSQFSPYLTAPEDPASPVAQIQEHVMANIGERHPLEALARLVGMSARSLARHFLHECGVTPHEFVERARVDAARAMLEGTGKPLTVVAYECGFGKVDRMRIIFSERLGVTPAQFRASFRREPGESGPTER